MRCDGRLRDMTPAPSAAQLEAERKAKADREWAVIAGGFTHEQHPQARLPSGRF
jgi:hypothetical protein